MGLGKHPDVHKKYVLEESTLKGFGSIFTAVIYRLYGAFLLGCIRHHQAAICGWIHVPALPEELFPRVFCFSFSLVSRTWELKLQ